MDIIPSPQYWCMCCIAQMRLMTTLSGSATPLKVLFVTLHIRVAMLTM
jgi:hypothetical protein